MDDLPYESLLGLENVRKLEKPTTAATLGKGFVQAKMIPIGQWEMLRDGTTFEARSAA